MIQKGDRLQTRGVEDAFEHACKLRSDDPAFVLATDQFNAYADLIGAQEREVEVYSVKRRSKLAFCFIPGNLLGKMSAEEKALHIFPVPFFALITQD